MMVYRVRPIEGFTNLTFHQSGADAVRVGCVVVVVVAVGVHITEVIVVVVIGGAQPPPDGPQGPKNTEPGLSDIHPMTSYSFF